MKIGFIGCGNMANAIIKGIVQNDSPEIEKLLAYDVYTPASEQLKNSYNALILSNEYEVAEKSDIVILAVKPNVIGSVLQKISKAVAQTQPLIISIAAGKTLEFLRTNLKAPARIVRVMPNINARVGEAISAYCCTESVTKKDKKNVEFLMSCVGKIMPLDENYFALFGVIGGCAPAYTYMFIDALARAAVKNGMKKSDALKIAAQTVYGSAKMIMESDEHPWQLIDSVCSPGGTTIEGVLSLQNDGFESAVHNAVQKALDKDKKL